jgi:hypothetical protein
MKAKKVGGEKVLPSPGTHIAILIQVIDWGTQEDSFGKRRKVELLFELPEETHVFDESKGEQPLIVDRKFALSISKNSALKKAIEGVIGSKLEEEEYELEDLLNRACQLQLDVIEKDGYKNVEVLSYMPLSKSDAKRKFKAHNPVLMLDLDNFDEETFAMLPQWKQDKIKVTDEYKAAVEEAAKSSKKKATPPPAAGKTGKLFKK